tara:strand:- start:399 stop:896 length:498 start_codon:yes stop_codon:yes gene_type:complete
MSGFQYQKDKSLFYGEYAKDFGDTDLQVEKYIVADDPRMNYIFIKPENIETQRPKPPEVIARELFDYGVVIKKGEEENIDSVGTLDTVVPISYAQINKSEQGEDWYRNKYPNLPEDFYGIIARYTWGVPFTKKEIKNTTKKIRKKKTEIPQGFSMIKGDFTVDLS